MECCSERRLPLDEFVEIRYNDPHKNISIESQSENVQCLNERKLAGVLIIGIVVAIVL